MSEYRQLKRQVGELLTALGPGPEDVASTLVAQRVSGLPRSNQYCPVACYLRAVLGADPRIRSVAVGPCTVVLGINRSDGRPAGRLMAQLPKPVRQFVVAFDHLAFPGMLRTTETDGGDRDHQRIGEKDHAVAQ